MVCSESWLDLEGCGVQVLYLSDSIMLEVVVYDLFFFTCLASKMENDVVSLPLRCRCPGGGSFNLLITFYREGNYMAPFVTCEQYYRAITPYVNAIKNQSLFTLRIMTV